MYKVLAILPEDLSAGFALAGVEVSVTSNAAESESTLINVLESNDYGIVIIDEEHLADFDEKTRRTIADRTVPLLIPIPGTIQWRDLEKKTQDDYVARLIRRAVGYQLNIRL